MANLLLNLGERSERSVSLETGIPLATLRRRLVDPSTISVSELLRLAECLGTTPQELLGVLTGEASSEAVAA